MENFMESNNILLHSSEPTDIYSILFPIPKPPQMHGRTDITPYCSKQPNVAILNVNRNAPIKGYEFSLPT